VDRFEVRVSITKLLIVLIVVIVPLSIIGFVLTTRSDRSLDNALGNDYKALAQTYGNQVADYMSDRVADVNAMAADSSVLAAVSGRQTASNAKNAAASKVAPNTNASEFLRQRTILDPRFLNVIVTDANGNVVASASQPPRSDYSQDEFWQSVYNKGQGAMKISDILDNEVRKAYYVNVGFPINDAAGNFLGVLSAAVNISPLLAHFQQNEIGNGAQAALVDENGMIVSAPNTDVFARRRSAQFDSVRDAMGSNTAGQQSGWTMASVNNVGYIVGYASAGGKRRTEGANPANPGWVVLVTQRESVAAAPIRGLERFALLMVILAIFMLTLLFVYWYLHHKQRFEDIEARPEEGTAGRAAAASI
jgi:preprotein translocase subunit SecG